MVGVRRSLLVLGFVSAGMIAACRKPPAPASTSAEKPYPLRGVVISADRAAGTVTLKHEAIPGYMDAMTMPFAVGDRKILDDLKPGDTLEAKLLVGERSSHLEGVVVSRPPGAPAEVTVPAAGPYGKPGDPVPVTELVDQDGKSFSLAGLKGEAVAVTFIFTRCPLPDFCPRMNLNFSETERLLAADPKLYAKTRLLSVSFDPTFDTPEILKAFREPFLRGVPGVSPGHWRFATGTLEHIKEFAGFFGLTYLKTGEQFVHSLATAVVAPDGTLFSMRRGNDWEAKELVEDLRKASTGGKPKAGA